MSRELQEPTIDQRGDETHPAFGLIQISRGSGTPRALFDSETKPSHTISLQVMAATRHRDLSRDWIHPTGLPLIEVEMTEAQWAQAISSLNTSGTPVTIRATQSDLDVPGLPFAPRLALSRKEAVEAAAKAFERIEAALAEYAEHPTKPGLRKLQTAVEHVRSNIDFASASLAEHAEEVVNKARADIEAMVSAAAERSGVQGLDAGATVELTSGKE